MLTLPWLDDEDLSFPPVTEALTEPNGLLAVGGDLRPERLLTGYCHGIFPWFEEGQPPLWWSPSPRMVLFPEELHIPKSLQKTINKGIYRVTINQCFEAVMRGCAEPRRDTANTWISEAMIQAYCQLHRLGYAHSIEAWADGELAGGFYGIRLDRVFFGESMFARRADASKVAFVIGVQNLMAQGCRLIDCQVHTDHLDRFGGREIERSQFCSLLLNYIESIDPQPNWQLD